MESDRGSGVQVLTRFLPAIAKRSFGAKPVPASPENALAAAPVQCIASISAKILIVAKFENVSDTAYGKMIWSFCLIAPQV